MSNESQIKKEDKVYKSVTIITLLLILAGVVAVVFFEQEIFKEQKIIAEKHEERIKMVLEEIKEAEENIVKFLWQETEFIREINIESEKRVSGKIDNTSRRITVLNKTYESILKEQEKKRVESLYSDKYLADKMGEAALLMKEGKINQAHAIYELVAGEQPENKEARFYMLYSLFLKNRSDREEYIRIKNGFNALEKEGYIRKEMTEVLSYIEGEENG